MELILVRHGLPLEVANDDGSRADPDLSKVGHAQAARMAQWLSSESPERVYSSPMARAKQTARPLLEQTGHSLIVEPNVAEFDQNESSYIPLEEMKRRDDPRWHQMMRSGWYTDTDPVEFQRKVVEALEGIIADNPGGRVAVVCHGGVINVWTAHLLKLERFLFFRPQYTSLNRYAASSKGARGVVSLNETGHLRGL